ncbi:nuclear transport factor 2 family protein [Shimia abyssi]|uniref:Ketosteroid isomerase-like protein n=1 Tax=Shimia abyssi TaxID=1662395 RepID=A0A2P8FJ18_9RHOB|nr:nuclear transport factor 2 family protein [Shimia abyssi]PSL21708.1 ketosteroid isomerase-like protein [Shimia abyssi]
MNRSTLAAAAIAASTIVSGGAVAADQAANIQTIKDFYQFLENKDVPSFAELLADEAVQDMPYAPSNFMNRVETREGIHELFAGFPDATNHVRFDILAIYPTNDANVVLAEIDGMIDFKGAEKPYLQQYMTVFNFDDEGKITLFREYFNPIPFAEAVGLGKYVPAVE